MNQPAPNIAARAGRWSAQHRRKAIVGWLVFVVLAVGIGGALGTKTLGASEKGVGESGRADRALHDAGLKDAASETILVTAPKGRTVHAPIVEDALKGIATAAKTTGRVSLVREPQISADQRSALVQVQLKGEADKAGDAVDPIAMALNHVRQTHLGVGIEQTGDGSIAKAYDDTMKSDFKKAELFSVPITFAILFLAFGALVAAGIPVLLGLTAVAAGLGLIAIPSQALPIEETASSVLLLIGLAVGVDYALFYLRREREERAAGKGPEAALEAAAATSGRAILVSGFTVMASVAGMFAAQNKWYSSYALAMIIVVAIAMAGSVTVLPALLSKLGDRVERGRLPFTKRRAQRAGEAGRVWSAVLDRVLRRPLIAAIAATAVLLALAAPGRRPRPPRPGHGLAAPGPPRREDLRARPAGLPGRQPPRRRRGPGRRRHRAAGGQGDRPPRRHGRRRRPGSAARSAATSAPTARSPASPSRSPATASRTARRTRSTPCATTSSRWRSVAPTPTPT